MKARLDILGIFPSFDSTFFGGVQASGREAWRSITGCPNLRADAFFYESGAPKLPTLLRAVRRRTPADTVLVWHSGLLKLAPFIAPSTSRLVLFLHGIEVWREPDPFTRLLMRKTGLFLSNSDYTWGRFTAIHPGLAHHNHKTVHLGLGDVMGHPPSPPDILPAALMIGRLSLTEDYKGHREMIQAWPLVLKSMPDAELWIVGDGDLRPLLEQLSQALGLTRHVRFFGPVSDTRKQELLQRCRVLLLPSAGEGFGLVYLEAMRMGRPCIVSTLDAGSEVVHPPEAGLAVDPNNSAQAARALLTFLSTGPEWEQSAARAQHRYASRFTASHFHRRLREALFDNRAPEPLSLENTERVTSC